MHNTLHRFPSYQTGALQTNMQRVAMTESPFPVTQIESLVRDTRRARLADEDLTEDDVADMRNSQLLGEPPLIGDCAANAVALCKTLDDEYFNPILVWGALHYDDDETGLETFCVLIVSRTPRPEGRPQSPARSARCHAQPGCPGPPRLRRCRRR